MSLNRRVLIAVAPNGARKTKQHHASIPLTAEEIAIEAEQCVQAGAGMMHLHVRDADAKHSLSVTAYKQAISSIRERCGSDLFVQVTSEAVGIYSPTEQFEMIHALKPDAVSIGVREIKSLAEPIINQHINAMRDNAISPQFILYSPEDFVQYQQWLSLGVLPGSAYPVLFVIGRAGVVDSYNTTLFESDAIKHPAISSWMVCAFGDQEFSVCQQAVKHGGHVRIGFENNTLLKDGRESSSNAEMVAEMSQTLRSDLKLTLANAEDARQIMKPDW